MKFTALTLAIGLLTWWMPAAAGDIDIRQPWARASAGAGKTAAAYVTIVNGGAADALIGAATPVAARAALHGHQMDGDMMKMRPIDRVALAPGATVILAPGGIHIMMFGLTRRLVEGETFPLTLTFENAGALQVTATVAGVGAKGPPHAGH